MTTDVEASPVGRLPPADVPAECAVLGAMMLSTRVIGEVVEFIGADDFYRPAHECVFQSILDLYAKGTGVDPITVAADLTRRGELTRVGGATYLHTLIASVTTVANAGFYAEIVRDKATLRRLLYAGESVTQLVHAANSGAQFTGLINEVVDQAQQTIYRVADERTTEQTPDFATLVENALAHSEAIGRGEIPVGIPTGYLDLDSTLHGLQPGNMITIAGRPAMGKSLLASGIAQHCALRLGKPAVIFSLEMSALELTQRILAAEANVPLTALRSGHLSDQHWARLVHAQSLMRDAPLILDDSANLTLPAIRARMRKLAQQHTGLGVAVIDYLQLLSPAGRRAESEQVQVAEYSTGIKHLAREFDVPIIAVAQLNRGPEARVDKKPQLSDLRSSGQIEQDSDVVLLLHREDYYDKQSSRAGEMDVLIAKHRNGPTGVATLAFAASTVKFVNHSDAANSPFGTSGQLDG